MLEKNRIFIYASDVAVLTGKGMRTAYKIRNQIRKFFNKEPHQLVTFEESHQYMGSKP